MPRQKRSAARSKIAIDDAEEVKYWSKHFGITSEELQRLVGKVGNSAAAVRKELQLGNVVSPRSGHDLK
jgi:hypothetical protein